MVARTPTTTPIIGSDPEWIRTSGGSVAHLLVKHVDDNYVITACSRILDWYRCYDADLDGDEPQCVRCLGSS